MEKIEKKTMKKIVIIHEFKVKKAFFRQKNQNFSKQPTALFTSFHSVQTKNTQLRACPPPRWSPAWALY